MKLKETAKTNEFLHRVHALKNKAKNIFCVADWNEDMCHGQPKLDQRGLVMKHWLRRCFLIICNRFWLSIIPVIWVKGFSPVSYPSEIQASFFAAALSDRSFRHTSCKTEHCTWTASMLKRLKNSSAEHWFTKSINPFLAAWHKIHFIICNCNLQPACFWEGCTLTWYSTNAS